MSKLTNRQKVIAYLSSRISDEYYEYSDYLERLIIDDVSIQDLLSELPEIQDSVDLGYWYYNKLPKSLYSNVKKLYNNDINYYNLCIVVSSLITRSFIELDNNSELEISDLKVLELSNVLDSLVNNGELTSELLAEVKDLFYDLGIDDKFSDKEIE